LTLGPAHLSASFILSAFLVPFFNLLLPPKVSSRLVSLWFVYFVRLFPRYLLALFVLREPLMVAPPFEKAIFLR